jgi:hypothetical protein
MARNYQDKDIKLLWGQAAARCAFPGCRVFLVLEQTAADPIATIGEMAHIVAHAKGPRAPRTDPDFPDHLRDRYENLILLCNTHHEIVDVQPNTYSAVDLRHWKAELEQYVTDSLTEEITKVTFVELEMVTKALLNAQVPAAESFVLTPPLEKMKKNGLSERSAALIRLGLANASLVEEFVAAFTMTVSSFSDDLKAGFVAEYNARVADGLAGDELFEAMREFAVFRNRDFLRQAAGLSVLTYLFEKCEVFEK